MTVDVGLVGAGPWASSFHAPLLAAGPQTRLSAVWARRPDAAAELAHAHGALPASSFTELLDRCDAVAFAVPPEVQAELGVLAARAGKALLLDKPVAADLDGARRLAEAVGAAGVGSLVVLTARYTPAVQHFLEAAQEVEPAGAQGRFWSGALLSEKYAGSAWRHQRGALHDIGPHQLDLLEAVLGPAEVVAARAQPMGLVDLTLDHSGGARSAASLTLRSAAEPTLWALDVVGPGGTRSINVRQAVDADRAPRLAAELDRVAHQPGHPLDVWHGLHLQELIDQAERLLAR